MTDDLHRRLDRETEKLEKLRGEEQSARSKWDTARRARDLQEEEVTYLFHKLVERAQA